MESSADPGGTLALGIGMLAALAIGYFFPALVAHARGRESLGLIALANLFLGWTVIGWFVLLIVAFMGEGKTQREHRLREAQLREHEAAMRAQEARQREDELTLLRQMVQAQPVPPPSPPPPPHA